MTRNRKTDRPEVEAEVAMYQRGGKERVEALLVQEAKRGGVFVRPRIWWEQEVSSKHGPGYTRFHCRICGERDDYPSRDRRLREQHDLHRDRHLREIVVRQLRDAK